MSLPLSVQRTQVQRLIAMVGDTSYGTKIDDWLNQRYDDIIRRFNWPQLRRTSTVSSVTDVETMVLPKDVDQLIQIQDRVNDIVLEPTDPSVGAREGVDVQDVSGIPERYWLEEDTINAQPTSASVLAVVSNSGTDTTQVVRIWGLVNGEEDSETVTLTGTTPVNTSKSFSRVDRVSKDGTTVGRVRITSNSGAVVVADMGPAEYTARYVKVHLLQRPNGVIVYNITYKYKVLRLINDQDIPVIPCHTAMIIGAYAQALEEFQQFAKAQIEWAKYGDAVQVLMDQYERQGDTLTLFRPTIDPSRIDHPRTRGF